MDFETNLLDQPKVTSPINNLETLASNLLFSPRNLDQAEIPELKTKQNLKKLILEETVWADHNNTRIIMTGNSHKLIFPMLNLARNRGMANIPITEPIINIDYHADIDDYDKNIVAHEASWQKAGVDKGIFSPLLSYNYRPPQARSGPYKNIALYTSELPNLTDRSFGIVSIDLDFLKAGESHCSEFMPELLRIVGGSSVTMLFSSSQWWGIEDNADLVRTTIQSIYESFRENGKS